MRLLAGPKFPSEVHEGLQIYSEGTECTVPAMPVSGPVMLVREGKQVWAMCLLCGKGSEPARLVPAPFRWAQHHRCDQADILNRLRAGK